MQQPNFYQRLKSANGFGYFTFKACILVLMLLGIDYTIGSALKYLYLKQRSGWEYWTKHSINDTKADMIIVGSSRAQQQYDPTYFEERLNHSCYNAGRDGQSILYQYPVLMSILDRHHPKAVLLEVENRMFAYSEDSYDRLSCLLPFYNSNETIDSVLLMRGEHERIKLLSKMYPYNSLALKVIAGTVKTSDEVVKGYLPLYRSLQHEKHPVTLKNDYTIDSNRVYFFTKIIERCKASHIQVYLSCSPYYSDLYGNDTSLQMVKTIAERNDIPFFDMSKGHAFLNDPKLFDDTAHVNRTGSKILSNLIVDSILKYRPQLAKR